MAAEVLQMPSALKRADQKDHLFWHERDWFIMIEWAKMLPVYQNLDLKDKVLSLLRHSAITFPSLVQCFYTPDVGPDTIVFPDGTFFDRTMNSDKSLGFQRKNFKMLDNLLEPIRRIKIDQNEFAGARAVFFLNPGNFEYDSDADDLSMSAKSQIAIARSAITNALYRYMVQKRGAVEAADKFGKLMLLGTAIATMSCEMREAVIVADFFEQIQFSDFARQILFSNNCDNIINNPLIIQQQQQQSAITNIPNYNLNQNSIASLTNNHHHQKQQQQPPNSSTISPQTQSLLVAATPQTSLNGMLLGGNTPATAVNNNTPMNVLNGLSNYFANGIQQQQSLQQTQQQPQTSLPLQHQPQTVFPLPQLQQQIIEQTQKQSFQQHQRQQQQQITNNNFVQQQLYFSQQQQNTPIQFINNSFPPTSLNPTTLQQQQNFRQIQLQQQLHQQQHFNQPTIVPYPTQQHAQPSPHQQQQQPNTPQLSQPTSLRQPTPHSQTNPVRTPQNSVVSPGRPISRHPTPQQLAGTNWQQAQLVQNQNNNVPPQTQFDQAYIYQTKLFDASPLQKDQQPFTPTFFSGPNSDNSTAQSHPASAQSEDSSPPSIVNIQ
uniref:NR LBD domain-containing protein n=1 Tax=Meloidogyne javanica TaxID=6303 RepID=A0A915LS39_MELJA